MNENNEWNESGWQVISDGEWNESSLPVEGNKPRSSRVHMFVCVYVQSDAVCIGVREDGSETGSEGVVEDRDEQSREDHRPASRQRQLRKTSSFSPSP